MTPKDLLDYYKRMLDETQSDEWNKDKEWKDHGNSWWFNDEDEHSASAKAAANLNSLKKQASKQKEKYITICALTLLGAKKYLENNRDVLSVSLRAKLSDSGGKWNGLVVSDASYRSNANGLVVDYSQSKRVFSNIKKADKDSDMKYISQFIDQSVLNNTLMIDGGEKVSLQGIADQIFLSVLDKIPTDVDFSYQRKYGEVDEMVIDKLSLDKFDEMLEVLPNKEVALLFSKLCLEDKVADVQSKGKIVKI